MSLFSEVVGLEKTVINGAQSVPLAVECDVGPLLKLRDPDRQWIVCIEPNRSMAYKFRNEMHFVHNGNIYVLRQSDLTQHSSSSSNKQITDNPQSCDGLTLQDAKKYGTHFTIANYKIYYKVYLA